MRCDMVTNMRIIKDIVKYMNRKKKVNIIH